MEWDFASLQKKLDKTSKGLKETEKTFKESVMNISLQDETKESYETLYETMTDDEKEYHVINEKYKTYISMFSHAYISMSEFYYGPELPYDVYERLFKKEATYLDSKQGIQELYSLFIFYMMFESSMNSHLPK